MAAAQDLHSLVVEHHQLDEQVRNYTALSHPSTQEQLEEAALKKRKLQLKDLIAAFGRERDC